MHISELEHHLAVLREHFGDVEIFEATREYGFVALTDVSVQRFIRIETTSFPQEPNRAPEKHLVIGKH